MNRIRTAALVAALVAISAASLGQEKKDAPPATPPAATPASPPRESPPPPPSASEPQRGVVKDDEFIPTQDIPPDEGVTFPVGI